MKKIIMILLLIIFFVKNNLGQTNFQWEITDSIQKSKSIIYSETKLFISEAWKSSNDVIQNDDKESGIILVKAIQIKNFTFAMGTYEYIYNYTVTFRMKENKFKFTIDNVYCESARMTSSRSYIVKIQPFDGENCPETGTFGSPGLPKKKAIILMKSLKEDLQKLADNYIAFIKGKNKLTEEW